MLLRQVAERDIHGTEPPVRGAARGLGMMRQPEHMAELMERFFAGMGLLARKGR